MKRFFICALFFPVFLCNFCWAKNIAVIVNQANQIDRLSTSQLARIYKGQQLSWPDGKQIVLVNRPTDSAIRKAFYQKALDSKPTQKFYLPGSPIPLRSIVQESIQATLRFVKNMPEAIGYVFSSELEQAESNQEIKIIQVIEVENGHIRSSE